MNHLDSTRTIKPIPPEVDRIARKIVDAAFCVHCNPGPGVLEGVYENCLAYVLNKRGLRILSSFLYP